MVWREADVEHMFERFTERTRRGHSREPVWAWQSAKWIVDKHRGCFQILSRKDLGTRVRIILPE